MIILYNSFLLVINYFTKSFTSFTTSRKALVLVKLITCKALGLMQIAHLQSISSARTYKLNTITFTHLTQLHITILHAVLRVLGEPTINVL